MLQHNKIAQFNMQLHMGRMIDESLEITFGWLTLLQILAGLNDHEKSLSWEIWEVKKKKHCSSSSVLTNKLWVHYVRTDSFSSFFFFSADLNVGFSSPKKLPQEAEESKALINFRQVEFNGFFLPFLTDKRAPPPCGIFWKKKIYFYANQITFSIHFIWEAISDLWSEKRRILRIFCWIPKCT